MEIVVNNRLALSLSYPHYNKAMVSPFYSILLDQGQCSMMHISLALVANHATNLDTYLRRRTLEVNALAWQPNLFPPPFESTATSQLRFLLLDCKITTATCCSSTSAH